LSLSKLINTLLIGTFPFVLFPLAILCGNGALAKKIVIGLGMGKYANYALNFGGFDNPNGFGSALLVIILASIMAFGFHKTRKIRLLLSAYLILLILLLFFTYHRSALFSLIACCFVFCFLISNWKRRLLILLLPITMLIFLIHSSSVSLPAKWRQSFQIIETIVDSGLDRNKIKLVTTYRSELWIDAVSQIMEHPIFGNANKISIDLTKNNKKMEQKVSNQIDAYKPPPNRSAHSFLLDLGSFYGLPAILLFLSFNIVAFRRLPDEFRRSPSLLAIIVILVYETTNGGLMYSLQLISVLYLFILSFTAIQERIRDTAPV
jgi:hypothetical protein